MLNAVGPQAKRASKYSIIRLVAERRGSGERSEDGPPLWVMSVDCLSQTSDDDDTILPETIFTIFEKFILLVTLVTKYSELLFFNTREVPFRVTYVKKHG